MAGRVVRGRSRLDPISWYTVLGATIVIVVAIGVAWFFDNRLTDILLQHLADRAMDQVELGIRPHVTAEDFELPVAPAKLDDLGHRLNALLARSSIRESGVIRIKIFAPDGTIIYSNDAELRGRAGVSSSAEFAKALAGSVQPKVSGLSSPENADLKALYGSALEVYVPFTLEGRIVGVYEVYQSLTPLQPLRLLIWGTVFGGFAILLGSLFLVVRVAATRIQGQQAKRERAEEDLRTTNETLRVIIEATPLATFALDLDGNIRSWNPAAERMFGWRAEEVIGGPLPIVPQDEQEAYRALRKRILRGETVHGFETRRQRRDRSAIEVSMSSAPLFDAAGRLSGNVVVLTDVTERKRAEAALVEASNLLRLVIDASPVAIFSIDRDGIIRSWNSSAEQMFGWSKEEVLGRFNPIVPEEKRTEYWDLIGRAFRGETFRDVEVCRRRRDGRNIDLSVSTAPLFDAEGKVSGVVSVLEDISGRREAERQKQALAQMEKLRALGQMASGVAHDLNQYLALVAGHGDLALELLKRTDPELERLRDLIEVVVQAAMDGAETVRRLLVFARPRRQDAAALVDLGELLRGVAKLTAPNWRDAAQAQGRPIGLQVEVEGDTTIQGWPESLREVFTNLVFNAVDALPHGGNIRLIARRQGDTVEAQVADTGIGMTPEIQARLFEPFYSTKGERGSGLGLAVVFGIVSQHKGTIAVDSAVGRGTTFRLCFPAAIATSVESCPAAFGGEAGKLNILVVDDDPSLRQMLFAMLSQDDHRVTVTASGEEALERLEEMPIDLVISDLGMGAGMNGWDLAKEVHQRFPSVRFALATGWGAQIDRQRAIARGVEAVISKPYRLADLKRLTAGR